MCGVKPLNPLAESLVDARWLPGLRALTLTQNKLTRAGWRCLLAAPKLALHTLACEWNRLGDRAIDDLLKSPTLPSLRVLRLRAAGLGDAAAQALAACPNLSQLTTLELPGNAIGDAGRAALLASPHLGPAAKASLVL